MSSTESEMYMPKTGSSTESEMYIPKTGSSTESEMYMPKTGSSTESEMYMPKTGCSNFLWPPYYIFVSLNLAEISKRAITAMRLH